MERSYGDYIFREMSGIPARFKRADQILRSLLKPEQVWRPVSLTLYGNDSDDHGFIFTYEANNPPVVWKGAFPLLQRGHLDLPATLREGVDRKVWLNSYIFGQWKDRRVYIKKDYLEPAFSEVEDPDLRMTIWDLMLKPYFLLGKDGKPVFEDAFRMNILGNLLRHDQFVQADAGGV